MPRQWNCLCIDHRFLRVIWAPIIGHIGQCGLNKLGDWLKGKFVTPSTSSNPLLSAFEMVFKAKGGHKTIDKYFTSFHHSAKTSAVQ